MNNMSREVFILILLIISLSSNSNVSWSFTEIGLGEIRIGGLEHIEKNASFSSQITGQVTLNVTLYKKGSLTIKITINNITFSISKTKIVSVTLNSMNTIKIDIVNTFFDEGIVYGNSTIAIVSVGSGSSMSESESITQWSRTLFVLSIVIPPIILILYSRKAEIPEEDLKEALVIEG